MSVALAVLLVGLLVAGVSAAVGVAAATVSQHELTRWVAYKLRGSAATVSVLQNPGRTLATANMLTTVGGYILARLEHPAESGERVECEGFTLVVTDVAGRRVRRVRIVPTEGA